MEKPVKILHFFVEFSPQLAVVVPTNERLWLQLHIRRAENKLSGESKCYISHCLNDYPLVESGTFDAESS